MQLRLETTLKELVAIPSVSGNAAACKEVLEYARAKVAPLGLHIVESEPDVSHPWFYATTHNTKTPDVLLAAHLDVVPGSTESFVLKKQGDKLIGRGVYDMKFAAACYIEFLQAHASELADLNMGILFSTDEELGGDSMLDILATGLRPGVVFIPDGGGNWKIESQAKGFYGIQLQASGKTAHGSRPWEGDNALHRIMDIVHVLRREYPLQDPNETTLSVTGIKGGLAVNQIADSASALIDFRTFDAAEHAAFKKRLFELAELHGVEVTLTQQGDPVTFQKDHPKVKPFLAAMRNVLKKEPGYVVSYGGTDARYFVPYDIPSIIMDPPGGSHHSEDEWLSAEGLSTYYELVKTWVLSTKQ